MTYANAACIGQADLMYGFGALDDKRALCASCPVLARCDADWREQEVHAWQVYGFRAGLTATQRVRILRSGRRSNTLRRVAVLLEGGYSVEGIANMLGVTERTVYRYRQEINASQSIAA